MLCVLMCLAKCCQDSQECLARVRGVALITYITTAGLSSSFVEAHIARIHAQVTVSACCHTVLHNSGLPMLCDCCMRFRHKRQQRGLCWHSPLPLTTQHSAQTQVLCAAAQACKDWREAVQLCGVCNTAVVFDAAAGPAAQLQELAAQARRTDKELDSQRIACRLVRCMSNQGC